MEPLTPTPSITHGANSYPLAWTKRSEAIISRYGMDLATLVEDIRNRRKMLYALCVGLKAALPVSVAPDEPEDVAEWLPDAAAQIAAAKALLTIIAHAYPKPAQKKSASNS